MRAWMWSLPSFCLSHLIFTVFPRHVMASMVVNLLTRLALPRKCTSKYVYEGISGEAEYRQHHSMDWSPRKNEKRASKQNSSISPPPFFLTADTPWPNRSHSCCHALPDMTEPLSWSPCHDWAMSQNKSFSPKWLCEILCHSSENSPGCNPQAGMYCNFAENRSCKHKCQVHVWEAEAERNT